MEGRVSLRWFCQGAGTFLIPFAVDLVKPTESKINNLYSEYKLMGILLYVAVNYVLIFVTLKRYASQIAVRACMLGVVFGLGLTLGIQPTSWRIFGWYWSLLSFFHFSEYFSTSIYNLESLTLESFLLSQSVAYYLAAMASCSEFIIEIYFFPGLKNYWYISYFGLLLSIVGEVMRKAAMLTAGKSFNHYIQFEKANDHHLVTHGLYSWSRHPAYVGWFYWSVGTQITLCNPLCSIGFAYTSWKFFKERIEDEEITLLNFFGEEYLEYQKEVPTRLPFISGYKLQY
ncbi:protein-S-isoprenylcysteine O-methyltransferase-like [Antedon mediterranea]|uniref:protein-S-isoprenylcysteine O-methyltransferase-like n=1 Tax=Antedon mediterranea TaxID=105859 RepID=UPI003AF4ACF9